MTEDELGTAESRGDQLLQAERGRGQAAGEFGHERDARFFNAGLEDLGLGRVVEIEGRPAIDALAIVAGRQHWQRTIPLGREDQDHIDIVAGAQGAKAVHFGGIEIAGGLRGQVSHFTADGPDLKPIGERSQRRPMSRIPRLAQADNAHTKFHGAPW